MDAELTIKNYRCFPDSRPARIVVRDGFTAFLGVNNSGKSSLLRFFYEFRRLFHSLSEIQRHLVVALRENPLLSPARGKILFVTELAYNTV